MKKAFFYTSKQKEFDAYGGRGTQLWKLFNEYPEINNNVDFK